MNELFINSCFGWKDFSIAVEREVLIPLELKSKSKGKKIILPIPLCIGLYGHSCYPKKEEITNVNFEIFNKYIMEKQ